MIFSHGITPFKRQRAGGGVVWTNTNSVLFDGVDEYVNIDGVLTSLASTTVGTISAWVKMVDATPSATERIWAFGDTNASEYLSLHVLNNGKVRAQNVIGGTSQWTIQTDAAGFSDNTWHHIVVVQNATLPVIYIDDTAVAQTAVVSTDTTTWFNASTGLDNGRLACLNQNSGGNTSFLNGNLTNVLFVNAAVNAAGVTDIYNSGTPKDETGITNGVTLLRLGDHASDNYNSDVANEWRFYDSIGSNNSDSVNLEEADVEADTP